MFGNIVLAQQSRLRFHEMYCLQYIREEARTLAEDVQTVGIQKQTDSPTAVQRPLLHIPSGGCNSEWKSWPSLQAAGAEGNSFLIFKIFDAVGNLFISLGHLMQVSLVMLSCVRTW